MSSSEPRRTLRPIKRYVTTHDSKGDSTIDTAVPEQATPWQQLPSAAMFLGYTTKTFPVSLQDDTDQYSEMLQSPPGLSYGSSVCRVVDMAPGDVSPLHRTLTIDYGIVIEGQVELILDNCTRVMEKGDICVQRATMHAWRNMSKREWARMVFVLIPCENIVINGHEIGENMDHVDGELKEIFAKV